MGICKSRPSQNSYVYRDSQSTSGTNNSLTVGSDKMGQKKTPGEPERKAVHLSKTTPKDAEMTPQNNNETPTQDHNDTPNEKQ